MRRKLTLGAVAALLAAGGSVAVVTAAGQGRRGAALVPGHGHRSAASRGARSTTPGGAHGYLYLAASYLGVTRAQLIGELRSGRTLATIADSTPGRSSSGLIDALVNAKTARVSALVADGKISAVSGRRAMAHVRERVTAEVNRVFGAGGAAHTNVSVAASYLGVSVAQIRRDRRSGQSLAQIASATPGKSASGLIEALVAATTARRAASEAAIIRKRVTAAVDRPPLHAAAR